LKLIRQWLQAPIVESDQEGRPKANRPTRGTPQGGVLSPLLANLYLHGFDWKFHRPSGPAQFARARLVRYADDFVILARYQSPQISRFVERTIEEWLGVSINREKTRVVDLREKGATLDFLGYRFRYDPDRWGRATRYLNRFPSPKALAAERQALRVLTRPQQCFKPLPVLIAELNRHLKGWKNYFSWGYPRLSFRTINGYVQHRLALHVKRRSQRRYRPPAGQSLYDHWRRLGLEYL
jgi:RNA-directed DNA polymerase